MEAVIIDSIIYFPFNAKHGHGLCFCGNRKGWHQNYDVNEWILIHLLIHSQWRISIRNLDVTSSRILLKIRKNKRSMYWQRALNIFWQDSNNESKANSSLACFLFHFSPSVFFYFLFCYLSKFILLGLKYCKWSWIRLLHKSNKILTPGKRVYS